MTGFINSGILQPEWQRLFPRYGDFDGSVNDSITPSLLTVFFSHRGISRFAAGPSQNMFALLFPDRDLHPVGRH